MRADFEGEKDERLAALAAGGDRDAFDELVTRHRQGVYRLCWSAAGNAADADDAAQETFVRVYRSLPSYDPARPFGPWLRKIAWNCGLSVRRDGNAGVPRVAEDDAPEAIDPAPGPEEAAAGNEERQRVADALAGLPAELRMVMVLRAVEGLKEQAHLAIAVELAPKVTADDGKRDAIARSVQAELERLNSEFKNYAPAEYRTPKVTLHAAGDAEWFPVGVKHRYTRK